MKHARKSGRSTDAPGPALSRRRWLRSGIAAVAGLAGLAAAAQVPGARAQEAEPADGKIAAEMVTYPGRLAPLKGYLVRPKGATAKRPGVIVIHEVRGLNPHFRDIARRLAQEGMIAFVPDIASSQGFPGEGSDEVRDFLQKMPLADSTSEYQSAIDYLARQPDCTGAIGVIGFSWGGPIAAQLAALPGKPIRAAVLYYSVPASLDLVPKLSAPVQFHYAEQDPRTQPQIDPIEKKLIGYSKIYEQFVYESAKANFANESLPKWYNKKQADLAWERTLAFLRRQLGG